MATAKNHVQLGRSQPRVRVLKSLIFPLLLLTASSVPAQDARQVCDDRCLTRLYKEMSKRAERQEKREGKLDRKDLLVDVRKNTVFTRATRDTLVTQIKDGFSQFYIPNPTTVEPGEICVEPLSLRKVLALSPSVLLDEQDCEGVTPCVLPYDFDIPGGSIYITFALLTLSVDDMKRYINQQDGKFLRVYLNGNLLAQGALGGDLDFHMYTASNCGSGGCVVLVVEGDVWYPSAPPWPVWYVTIEFWDVRGGKESECPATIVPPSSLRNYWTHTIGATVITSRCTTCHTMDTPEEIYIRHGGSPFATSAFGVEAVLIPSLVDPVNQFVHHCQNCHESALPYLGASSSFPEKIWATPTEAQDINWARLVINNLSTWPSVICNKMITNLPTHAAREEHFHGDARLFWAVSKGDLPPPASLNVSLPTAPPHNYAAFLNQFDQWNDAGAPCP